MKTRLAVVTILALTTCLTRGEDLIKFSMDTVPTNGPKIEVDAKEKVEGNGSLKITTQWPTTVCVGEVTGPDIENGKLTFNAKVKADLDGIVWIDDIVLSKEPLK